MKYHPAEFIASMLNSVMGSSEKVAFYIRFAESQGIQVLPPDANESYARFTVKDNTIRFGLAAIKNAGVNVVQSIVRSREKKGKFTSLYDFCNKIDITAINKRVVESLIKAGAFDGFKVFRSQMLAVYEKILDNLSSEKKRNIEGQVSLFGGMMDSYTEPEIKYPSIKEFEKKYMLTMEKEMTGLYLSGHPLDEHAETLKLLTDTNIADIMNAAAPQEMMDEGAVMNIISSDGVETGASKRNDSPIGDGTRVILGGIITEVNKKVTKNNDMMAFASLEDLYGTIEVIVFPKVFEKLNSLIAVDQLVFVKGRVSIREDEAPKILCEDIQPLVKVSSSNLYVLVEDDKTAREILKSLKVLLSNYKGSTPVYLCTRKERNKYRLDRDAWVDEQSDVVGFLKSKFGEENVKLQ
jgi:DNA polymerase III subunit alpha